VAFVEVGRDRGRDGAHAEGVAGADGARGAVDKLQLEGVGFVAVGVVEHIGGFWVGLLLLGEGNERGCCIEWEKKKEVRLR
nr:hypothetical protein [Escherichia coli]